MHGQQYQPPHSYVQNVPKAMASFMDGCTLTIDESKLARALLQYRNTPSCKDDFHGMFWSPDTGGAEAADRHAGILMCISQLTSVISALFL